MLTQRAAERDKRTLPLGGHGHPFPTAPPSGHAEAAGARGGELRLALMWHRSPESHATSTSLM